MNSLASIVVWECLESDEVSRLIMQPFLAALVRLVLRFLVTLALTIPGSVFNVSACSS